MEYDSIISIDNGRVYLQSVDFYNIVTSSTGCAIKTINSSSSNPLSIFTYNSGTVQLINNGFEIRDDKKLGSFLCLSEVITVEINNIDFTYNIFNGGDSDFIYLENIYLLKLQSSNFNYNYSGKDLIYIDQTSLKMSIDLVGTYQTSTNIDIQYVVFSQNTANSMIYIEYNKECQNIELANNVFELNFGDESLITISYDADLDDLCINGGTQNIQSTGISLYFPPRFINFIATTFENCFAVKLFSIQKGSTVTASGLTITSNGEYFDFNSITILGFKNYEAAYLTESTKETNIQCTSLFSLNSVSKVVFIGNTMNDNSCSLIMLSDVKVSLVLSDSIFHNNEISGVSGLIKLQSQVSTEISNLDFQNNVLSNGVGAIILTQSGSEIYTISNCYFYNCTQAIDGNSLKSLILNNIQVENSLISQYSALSFTGASGTAFLSISDSTFTIASSSVLEISSDFNSEIDLQLTNCIFSWLTSASGIIIFDTSMQLSSGSLISNCEFSDSSGISLNVKSSSGTLQVSNTIFENFSSGSGIVAKVTGDSTVSFTDCMIRNNTGTSLIYLFTDGNIVSADSENCAFTDNVAAVVMVAGAIFSDSGSSFTSNSALSMSIFYVTNQGKLTLSGSSLVKNTVAVNGVIYITVYSSLEISDSTFTSNSAMNKGGVLFIDQDSDFTITRSIFSSNSASQGSVLFTQHCSIFSTFSNCLFENNIAYLSGCITALESSISIEFSIFTGNTAPSKPNIEAIYMSYMLISNSDFSNHEGLGAHISAESSRVTVSNSAFSDSYSEVSGSVIYTSDSVFECDYCTITNTESPYSNAIYCEKS